MDPFDIEGLARALFEEAGDALFLFDPSTQKLIDANPMAQRLSGFLRSEFPGMLATYLFRSEIKGGMTRLRQASRKTGIFHSQDGYILRTRQDGVWVAVNLSLTRLHVKPRALGLITARDVRAQREAHTSLAKVEAELKRVLSSVSDCLWSAKVNPAGEWAYRYLSPVVEKITGHPADYFLPGANRWWSIVHPEDRSRWEQAFLRRRSGQSSQEEYRILWPDDTLRWVRDSVLVRLDRDGQSFVLDGILTDVTERRRSDEALRQEKEFAETLLQTAQAIILVLDPEARIVRFNRYLEELSGHDLEAVKGQDWFRLFIPPADVPHIREAFLRADGSGAIIPLLTKGQQQREIQWSNRTLKDASGKVIGVLAIGHDITDLKEAQQRALQAERLAAIGQMVAGLAHESRNALQRGQACLEMLALTLKGQPKALELVACTQQAQDDLHRTYEEVTDYSAPVLLERQDCQLGEILQATWAQLAPLRKGRKARLREEGGASDLNCQGDRFRLAQVFRNILENALGACQDPVDIAVSWSEAEIVGRPAVRVAVRDNGPGLTPEQQQKIFEPFYTTKIRGIGLGMAIVKRIVEAHGGQIAVAPAGSCGTQALITLPRAQA